MNKYDMYDHDPDRRLPPRKQDWFDRIAQALLFGIPILWLVMCLLRDM